MLGTHVESIDFNLPVDAVTEKPLFAFSCNRIIRESYDGPLMRATDGTDIGVNDLSANTGKQIDLLYDQKTRHGLPSNNATCSGPYPTLQGNASEYWLEFTGTESFAVSQPTYANDTAFTFPTTDGNPNYSAPYPQIRVINSWHPHITSGNNYDLVQVQITGGVLTNMKLGNTSAGAQWVSPIQNGAVRGTDWEVQKEIASHIELLEEAGILVVCDPEGQGRKPVLTANNGVDELSLDVGTAYMRFALYGQGEQEDLFGGLDYPDLPMNGYVANYDTNILLRSVDGKGGEAVASRPLPAFSSMHIGKDMAGNNFEGKLFEIVICDFPIPLDAEQEVFDDWKSLYSLT